jgi:hypothetical protein
MAATSYEADTLVVEVDEPASSRRSSRRMGTEVDVHVLVEGSWHKRIPDHSFTSCGVHKIHSAFHSVRHPKLIGKLCDKCFTDYERGIAETANDEETKSVT